MQRLLPAIMASMLVLPAWTQDVPAPAFEVASVKQAADAGARGVPRGFWSPDANRVTGRNATLGEMIRYAWNVRPFQVVGPPWLEEERYDVEAKSAATSTPEELRQMVQSLLAERFRLAVHRENKDMAVYEMTVAKGGPKLTAAKDLTSFKPAPGRDYGIVHVGTVEGLARVLSNSHPNEIPIVDKTGLKGIYQVAISIEPGQDLPSALQEQLGLKLTLKKAPTEILVIDHADKIPAGN